MKNLFTFLLFIISVAAFAQSGPFHQVSSALTIPAPTPLQWIQPQQTQQFLTNGSLSEAAADCSKEVFLFNEVSFVKPQTGSLRNAVKVSNLKTSTGKNEPCPLPAGKSNLSVDPDGYTDRNGNGFNDIFEIL